MSFIKSSLLLIIFGYLPQLLAQTPESFKLNTHNDLYLISYAESGLYILDLYEIPKNKFQTRVWQKTFITQADRNDYLLAHYKNQYFGAASVMHDLELYTEDRNTKIWESTNQWSWSWEIKFAEWVRANVTSQFMNQYQIKTDCADLAVALRWIFSRIHFLPMANRLAGSNALFTNESMQRSWVQLPTHQNWWQDQRFMTALDYVMDNTFTHTVYADSYPIKINKDALLPGTHNIQLRGDTGHTLFVDRLGNPSAPVHVLYSNVPRKVRTLYSESFWMNDQPQQNQGGFIRFRWLEKVDNKLKLRNAVDMPFYSTEQFERSFMSGHYSFDAAVFAKLNIPVSPKDRLLTNLELFKTRIESRVPVVEQGYEICLLEDCSPGSVNYENWGTPSRDARVREVTQAISEELATRPPADELWSIFDNYLLPKSITVENQSITFLQLFEVFKQKSYSSDPRDRPGARWGVNP